MKCWKRTAKLGSLRRISRLFTFLGLVVLALVGSSAAQETTLHTQSNVVLVPALAKNPRGEIVYGLQAKDFVIEDDGVEQPVRLDEPPESQAISLVVAIQTGRRANYEFPAFED